MMDIKVEIDGDEELIVKFDKIADLTKVKEAVKKSTLNIQRNAKAKVPAKTGHLRRSIATKVSGTEGEVNTSNVKYAIMVEKGTRAHTITPKSRKALYWQGARHPVKKVNHPGSAAKPYLIPAFKQEKPLFIQNLKNAIKLD